MKKLTIAYALVSAALAACADQDLDKLVSGSLVSCDTEAAAVRAEAFADCRELVEIRAGAAAEVGAMAFRGCVNLRELYLPACTNVASGATLAGCLRLEAVELPLIALESAKAMGFPWQAPARAVVFVFLDGRYDRNGRKLQD